MADRSSTGKKGNDRSIEPWNPWGRNRIANFRFLLLLLDLVLVARRSAASGPIEADFNSCREFHVRLALNNRDANAIRAESGPLNEYG